MSAVLPVDSTECRRVDASRLGDAALILCTIFGTALASGWMLLLTRAEFESFSRYAEIESLWSRSLLLGIPAVLSLGSMAFGGWVVSSVFRAGWRRLQSRWGYGLYS